MLSILLAFFFTLASAIPADGQPLEKLQPDETGTIVIELETLRNHNGAILVSLYADDNGFPDEWEKAFRSEIVPITAELREIRLEDIPYGTYGLAVVHDENENMKLDTNFLGIPREGYGFSNNARGRFGPPRFADVLFTLDSHTHRLNITLNY